MKKTGLFILSVILLSSCKNLIFNGYVIEGIVKNVPGKATLEDFISPDLTVLEETTITDSTFKLKGYANEGIYRLSIGEGEPIMIPVYLKAKTHLKIYYDPSLDGWKSLQIKGNEETETMLNILVTNENSEKQYMAIKIQIDSAKKGTNTDSLKALLEKNRETNTKTIKTFIENATTPEVGVFAMNFIGEQPEELLYMINKLDIYHEQKPESPYVNQFRDGLKQYRTDLIGDGESDIALNSFAPEIVLPDIKGDTFRLSDYKGKLVLLDFWASWCAPCRQENPDVVKLYKKYKKYGFKIFQVSLDQRKEPWGKAVKMDGLVWPAQVSDLHGWESLVVRRYKIEAIPATFLLDDKGRVIAKNLRSQLLDKKLEELTKERKIDSTALN